MHVRFSCTINIVNFQTGRSWYTYLSQQPVNLGSLWKRWSQICILDWFLDNCDSVALEIKASRWFIKFNLFHSNRYSLQSLTMEAFICTPFFFMKTHWWLSRYLSSSFGKRQSTQLRNAIRLNDFFERTDRRQEPFNGIVFYTVRWCSFRFPGHPFSVELFCSLPDEKRQYGNEVPCQNI